MSGTPISHPSVHRANNAYVLVPPSPLSLSSYRPLHPLVHVVGSRKLKENTPLWPPQFTMSHPVVSSSSRKRKLSQRDSSSLTFDGVELSLKKSKLSSVATPLEGTQVQRSLAATSCLDSTNAFTYCHQCNKKCDNAAMIRCSSYAVAEQQLPGNDKDTNRSPCLSQYCHACLKNRYSEDFELLDLRARDANGAVLNFKCPRCKGICNCQRCRKSLGRAAFGRGKQKFQENRVVARPNRLLKVEVVIETRKLLFNSNTLRPLPILTWTQIPTSLSRAQVDERIFIREFALRFSKILDPAIAKTYLEELQFISGRMQRQDGEGDGWISEACVKALLLGLLGVLSKGHDNDISKSINATLKGLRSVGVNLNKLWAALASLREDVSKLSQAGEPMLTFPDPSPPPATLATARSLRNTHQLGNSVYVSQTTQMIPVLLSLMHSVLESAVIREDLDRCVKNSKDFGRDAKEAIRIENSRWEKEKGWMENATKDKGQKKANQTKRKSHKAQITSIENCSKIISRTRAPRFTILGTDSEGRAYYALSPSVAEREAAFEFLEVSASEKSAKPKRKGRTLSTEGDRELRDWSWFIAVWGKRPPLTPREKGQKIGMNKSDIEEEDNSGEERWWAFREPDEIIKVADWISIKSGLQDQIVDSEQGNKFSSTLKLSTSSQEKNDARLSPHAEPIKRLVTGLKDYAMLLQWRVRADKFTNINQTIVGTQTSHEVSNKGRDKESTENALSDCSQMRDEGPG